MDINTANNIFLSGVKERIYTIDHPEVIYWTDFFQRRFEVFNIFENFKEKSGEDIYKTKAVATQWYRFSTFMPWFLCKAASMVSSNTRRHYIVQIAFEELGMRDVNEIHAYMFKDASKYVGLVEQDFVELENFYLITETLQWLANSLSEAKVDDYIMGILLGLECPAQENIATLFSSMAYTTQLQSSLRETEFFKLHYTNEVEHIRLTVSNFLRFSKDETAQNQFIKGYDIGIKFWINYWSAVSALAGMLRNKS